MSEWLPIATVPRDGTVVRGLRFRDCFGVIEVKHENGFFLHDDGFWYRVDPPLQMQNGATHYLPAPETKP